MSDQPTVVTQTVKFKVEQTERSWSLVAYDETSGTSGVAAFGPIESLPLILGVFEKAGAMPKKNPLLKVVK